MTFKEILPRITGISTAVFGVSWTPPRLERDRIRGLLVFLEDKGILGSLWDESRHLQWAIDAVLSIRQELTRCLSESPLHHETENILRRMRTDCYRLLYSTEKKTDKSTGTLSPDFEVFRKSIVNSVAKLFVIYGLDVKDSLEWSIKRYVDGGNQLIDG